MKNLLKTIISGLLFAIPDFLYSQNISVETTHNLGGFYISTHKEGSDYVAFYKLVTPSRMMVVRLDSMLNVISVKEALDTIPANEGYSFDNSFQLESGYEYIVVGSKTGGSECVIKMDSAANIQWQTTFSYPFFSYTSIDNILLEDKSIVMAGYRLVGGGWGAVIRRVDSAGNTIFENQYTNIGFRRPNGIIDSYDGSIVFVSNIGSNQIGISRVDYFGKILDDTIISTPLGGVGSLTNCSLIPGGNIIVRKGTDLLTARYMLNHNLQILDYRLDAIKEQMKQYRVNQDSTFYGSGFTSSLNNQHLYTYGYDLSAKDSLGLDTLHNTITTAPFMCNLTKNEAILLGLRKIGSGPTENWLAIVDGLKDLWQPEPCEISRPQAAFFYDYEYPILTLSDNSSSGVKYNDTIYSHQWSTSIGQNGTEDSLLVLWDTVTNKTVDVELVISNWYGCTDTVNINLNFDPNGIAVEKPLEVKVYPNPTISMLNILIEEFSGEAIFKLYDLQGGLQMKHTLQAAESIVSLNQLPQGLYIYELQSEGQVTRGKVVKE